MHNHSTAWFSTLLALGAVSACSSAAADHSKPATERPRIKVDVATVGHASTPDQLTLTGKIAANQRADVAADTQGKVLAVLVERGQRVKRGQPIVELDVRSAALGTREAAAHLQAARSDSHLADEECGRTRSLFAQGAISKSELDRQVAQCESASQQVSAATAHLELLAKGITDGVVRAPFDGAIDEKHVTAGEWVATGKPLFTLIDTSPLKLELAVPEAQIASVQLGQQLDLDTVSRPGKTYRATVTHIGAEIGHSHSLTVEATLAATPDLVPGMFVEAQLIVGHTDRPTVPDSAVVKRGKTWHAFVVHDGTLEERVVTVGPSPEPGQVSVLRNLAEGEHVVRTINDQITDGLQVE